MSADDDEPCVHSWGEPEEVELGLGTLWSPLCKHCGAVKLQEEHRAHERRRIEFMLQSANAPLTKREDLAPRITHKEGPCHEVLLTKRGLAPTGRTYAP